VDDLLAVLRRRWQDGRFLVSHASGEPWVPFSLSLRAPGAAELLDQFDDARRWADRFERDSRTRAGAPRFRVEYRTLSGRNLGVNRVPARIWIDDLETLAALLGTTVELEELDALMKQTRSSVPAVLPWIAAHPRQVLEHRGSWEQVLATVRWIAEHDTTRLYIRQIDADGVDTKFVEQHRKLLDELLALVLPGDRIDRRHAPASFAARFQFRQKPDYVRFRLLAPQPGVPDGITELRLRADEAATLGLRPATIFVVENEISYLAFPAVPDAVVLFGSGYAVDGRELPWLDHAELVYWGDLDTHGFAILDGLRSRRPDVTSILMDHDTLLAHRTQWVREPAPTRRPLPHLTDDETAVYHDLVEDRFGPAVRLEQERVRFSRLEAVLDRQVPRRT
jgi:hypothetical protein